MCYRLEADVPRLAFVQAGTVAIGRVKIVEIEAFVAVSDEHAISMSGTNVDRRSGHQSADAGGEEDGCKMHSDKRFKQSRYLMNHQALLGSGKYIYIESLVRTAALTIRDVRPQEKIGDGLQKDQTGMPISMQDPRLMSLCLRHAVTLSYHTHRSGDFLDAVAKNVYVET